MQRSDFHTRIYDFQTVILRLYAPVFGGNSYENDKFLSFFVYILYTFGTDFRHNYFDCDKKVTICTKFVFFRRIKVLKIWTSKRYSLSMTRT